MSQYRVEKEAVPATLYLSDGSVLEGCLFLAPFSPHRSGPQTVEDLMNESGQVFPFNASDGKFLLVGKAAVVAVAVPGGHGLPGDFWNRAPARLRLVGAHVLVGSLLFEAGAGKRASDALNVPGVWMCLEAGGSVLWVSKAHLVIVEPTGV